MKMSRYLLSALFLLAWSAASAAGALTVKDRAGAPGDFPLAEQGRAASILVEKDEAEVVRIAADLLATDIERVTRVKPKVSNAAAAEPAAPVVIVGTLGKSRLIAELARRGKVDVKNLAGKWESFVIATVTEPFPGVPSALVIAGSDRRGTAYGVFELSEAIGISPWAWWADVPPRQREALVIAAGTHAEGPPSVKYRGIFINDEDWGLQPWAAKTFEPETGDIGPKTYAKVFELLLRLKANYLWPAMHPCTKAFNHYSENKHVADRYAIVMGSSHCEQMLRNNVDEWDKNKLGDWNPVTNLKNVLGYWETRVRENGKFDSVYTTGMRGIHDGAMPGGGTIEEKRQRMEKLIDLQRQMLTRHVNPDPSQVPQIFCPYKEVLDIYQADLKLPEDITIVWPDDNHGYIRQLPNAAERQRSGGHGVYYHISYWGRPHDYLWLESTSPALIWHEMTKAHELGARQLWVVNVGDIKPIEAGMTLFLELAWNIDRYDSDVQRTFLREFYAAQFGEKPADAIAKLKDDYFRLCAVRRPEHLGFNGVYPNTRVQNSDWSHGPENDEAGALLDRWLDLARRVEAFADGLPPESRDAYFQLVEYPASAGAAMAEKLILAEKARRFGAKEHAQRAEAALRRIEQLTERYNAQCGGKWRGLMDHRPRKLPVFDLPSTAPQPEAGAPTQPIASSRGQIVIHPANMAQAHDRDGAGWRAIEGLGPRGAAIAVLPRKDVPALLTPQEIRERAPVSEYTVRCEHGGEVDVILEALPTHRLTPAHEVLAAVSVNDADPIIVRFDQGKDDENDPTWQRNVLRHAMSGSARLRMPAGASKLKLWAAAPGVVIQRITLGERAVQAGLSAPAAQPQAAPASAPVRIMLVGDSTMCEYAAEKPDRGWGQFVAERFQPGSVEVANLARGGRSTKTFIKEGLWAKALAAKPDYIFVQFGHNDSHAPDRPESTDAATDYRDNLRRYVDEARAAGAVPILVTPMVRRTFKPDGKLNDNLAPYAQAMKIVAAEKQAALIDLHAASWALVEPLGPDAAQQFANKENDRTHFNEKGARAMADLVFRALPAVEPRLAALLAPPSAHASTPAAPVEQKLAVPNPDQLAFQDLELGVFIHFGIETFAARGARHGATPASAFSPSALDAEQWILAAKSMGATYAVLTARHEDGFCLWPTGTNDYNVKSSPYRDGQGDVVREFVEACRKHGLKAGFYTAPWVDTHWEVARGLSATADRFRIEKFDDHPELYAEALAKERAQHRELLTRYGPLVFIWADHAGRSDSIGPKPLGGKFREMYAGLARLSDELQPGCLYFGSDVEHAGNENGVSCYPVWYAVDTVDGTNTTVSTTYKWERDNTGDPRGRFFRPRLGTTTDGFSTGGWMWRGPRRAQPLDRRMQVYYETVGRGANVLVNFAPDRRGLVPDELVAAAKEFGDEIKRRFGTPLAESTAAAPSQTLALGSPRAIEHVIVMEDLRAGQKIAAYRLEAEADGKWVTLVDGQTVGHKRIDRFAPVTATAVRFTCTRAIADGPMLRRLAVFGAAPAQ